jgi:outer membrane biosynthesis protein TonB
MLHLAVFGAGFIAFSFGPKIVPVEVTPVTLLTSDQLAALTAATRADKPEQATAPDPEPEPQPSPPPAPTPAPVPTPPPAPKPQPKPVPAPKPAPTPPAPAPKPAPKPIEKASPTKPAAAQPQTPATKGVDLDALAKSLALNTKAAGPTAKASAPKGVARPETDLSDRAAEGQARATTMTALGPIRDKLIRLWNPNCGTDPAANVHFRVQMHLKEDGSLVRDPLTNAPKLEILEYPGVDFNDPKVAAKYGDIPASVARAKSAVARGAPYDGLPREDYNFWKTIVLNFDAKTACGVR